MASPVWTVLDFEHIGKAVVGSFSRSDVRSLHSRNDVRYVERDGVVRAIGETLPWGVDRIDADVAHDIGSTASGTDIAILDTGIDSDHSDLVDNLGKGYAPKPCDSSSSTGECLEPWDDDNGHGTHCAGIADAVDNTHGVIGTSTEATLHAVKVLAENGYGSYSNVAEGLEWVADQGYDVGSMSLGGESDSQTMKDACQYAYDKGVLLVAAASNEGPCSDCVEYPAKYSTVIAVSATEKDDDLADYSSTGPEVELAAPGTYVYSTYVGDDYAYMSGTSMATPHVSGTGAIVMADGTTNKEARQRLRDTAEDIGLSSNEQGYGLIDAEAADLSDAPTATLVNPNDGDTVEGIVTIQVSASDDEDDDTTLDVSVSIDGGSSRSMTYNSNTGYYEYDWDSSGTSDGDHTIQAKVTDSGGATTETQTITVTANNVNDPPSARIAEPDDGDVVIGDVHIWVYVDDTEDTDSELDVSVSIDDGPRRKMSYNSTYGFYRYIWNTTLEDSGTHTVQAYATDTDGATASTDTHSVIVANI